jgi:hypothetical protein
LITIARSLFIPQEKYDILPGMPKTRVIIELDEALAAGLEAAARRSQTLIEGFAAKVVARAVTDVEAWAEEDAAYAEYERTGEAIPIAAVEQWVRSWGKDDELPPPAVVITRLWHGREQR